MKNLLKSKFLPAGILLLGAVGFLLHLGLYAVGLDQKGLLPGGHPLETGLWVVTAAALALVIAASWNAKGSDRYGDNFGPSLPGALGNILMAAGILLTVLLNQPKMPNLLGSLWKLLGFVSAPCLVAAAFARVQGKQPFFLLHMSACLFLLLHIVNHYQAWSGNPQLQDYLFPLLGALSMMVFAYLRCVPEKIRLRRLVGLMGGFLCLAALAKTDFLPMYFGCGLWMLTNADAPGEPV